MSITTEREAQRLYWKEHSGAPTVEAMMLDSQAAVLDQKERPEILGMLPTLNGKAVVELGAGMGRFTGSLGKVAKSVLAVDFMENSILKNKELHGYMDNIKFVCADVTNEEELNVAECSTDLVFSNWLLMYLADDEVVNLANRVMRWLKPGGFIFFRESCFHQSGDQKRKQNPTHYRDPSFYNKIFEGLHIQENGVYYEFQLQDCKCVHTYVHFKKNQNQICWLWQKVRCEGLPGQSFQRFLDGVQYTQTGILRYERIFGDGFVSTGGLETTKEFVAKLKLKEGQKVLDVGCGIGGGDFYMAEKYDVEVYGIDLSINMVSIALERAIGQKCSVEFEVADCTKKEFPEEMFDVIYSRDTILHIHDKPALFRNFLRWLKPGGRLLISDYCKAKEANSEEFLAYVKQRGYDLHDVPDYGRMIEEAGFTDVTAEDRTEQFVEVLKAELAKTEKTKEKFIADFSEDDYNYIVNGWNAKLERCAKNEQKWGLFIARKPVY